MTTKLLRDVQIFVSPRLHLFVLLALAVTILDLCLKTSEDSIVMFSIYTVLYVPTFVAYIMAINMFISMASFYRFDLYWNIKKEEVYNATELYERRLNAARKPLAIITNVIAVVAYIVYAILTPYNILHYANMLYILFCVYMLYVKMPNLQKEKIMERLKGAD